MLTFPSSFPAPEVSLAASQEPNAIRTAMDSGAIRQRRRFMTERVMVRCSWSLSDVECGVFVAYHKYKLNLGNDWFIMPLPLGGDALQPHVVRIVEGSFTQQYQDVGYWLVAATLEVEERVVFSEDVLEFYLDVGFSDTEISALFESVNAFHYFLTVTYPPTQVP